MLHAVVANRRRIAILALVPAVGLAALIGTLFPRSSPPASTIVGAVPIGMLQAPIVVDGRTGRAFLLDDGILENKITFTKGDPGYSMDMGASGNLPSYNPTLRIVNTHTGRLEDTMPVNGGPFTLAADEPTGWVFVPATNVGNLQVLDARGAQSYVLTPYTGDPQIYATAVDPHSGHLFLATGPQQLLSPQSSTPPLAQHLAMLDGRTGATLRTQALTDGVVVNEPQPDGSSVRTFQSTLSFAVDARAGHIYVFDTHGRMTILDGTTGAVLATRRLPLPLAGAIVDSSTGRIFAFDASQNPYVMGRVPAGNWYDRPTSLVVLDARSGAVLRRLPAGTAISGAGEIALDEEAGRVVVLDRPHGAVLFLDARRGDIVQRKALGDAPLDLVLDPRRHRAFIGIGSDRRIVVLDSRTGAMLRTIDTLQQAGRMVVDPGSGHLFVTVQDTRPQYLDRWHWLPSWLRDRLPGVPPLPADYDPTQGFLTHTLLVLDPAR